MRIEIPGPVKTIDRINNNAIDIQNSDNSFSGYLMDAIEQVDKLQKETDSSSVSLATGDIQNLHQVMIDSEKAEIALQFTLQIRNKIIEAYQEIMRMQV